MNSKEYTATIVGHLSELRDLLIVIERGGDKTPDVLYKLAIEKSHRITDLVNRWRDEAAPLAVEIPAEYAQWLDGKTTDEVENPVVASETSDAGIDLSADIFTFDDKSVSVSDSDTESISRSDERIDENRSPAESDADSTSIVGSCDDDRAVQTTDDETLPSETDILTPVGTVDFDDTPIVEFPTDMPVIEVGMAEESDQEKPTETTGLDVVVAPFTEDEIDERQAYNRGESLDSETPLETPVTVGEMMSVRRAKELRRALSLNDRFRFRRELFGNSDIRMTETLALLDTMEGYTEAREYLTEDLGWDAEEPVVKEFLSLVENHFKS